MTAESNYNYLHAGLLSCFCCGLLTFSKQKNSGTLSECQTVWIHIRTNVFGPAKVINQQMTEITASKERVNYTVNPEIFARILFICEVSRK